MLPTTTLVTLISFLLELSSSSPVYNMQPAYITATIGSTGRNIRNLPCISRKSNQNGVCMFAIDCLKANGTHLGTCIDRFYFGSCCHVEPMHDIIENTIDTALIPSREPPHRLSTTEKLPTSIQDDAVKATTREDVSTSSKLTTISKNVPTTKTTLKPKTTTSRPPVTTTTTSKTNATITARTPATTKSTTTTTTTSKPTTRLEDSDETVVPIKLTTFQTVDNELTTIKPISTTILSKPSTTKVYTKATTKPTSKPTTKPIKLTTKPKPSTVKPTNSTTLKVTLKPRPTRPSTVSKPTKITRPTTKSTTLKPSKNTTKPIKVSSKKPIITTTTTATTTAQPTTIQKVTDKLTTLPSTIEFTTKKIELPSRTTPKSNLTTTKLTTTTTTEKLPELLITTQIIETTTKAEEKTTTTSASTTTPTTTTIRVNVTTSSSPTLTTTEKSQQNDELLNGTLSETNEVPTILNATTILEAVNGNPATNEIESIHSSETITTMANFVTWSSNNNETTISSSTKEPDDWMPITTPDGWVLLPSLSTPTEPSAGVTTVITEKPTVITTTTTTVAATTENVTLSNLSTTTSNVTSAVNLNATEAPTTNLPNVTSTSLKPENGSDSISASTEATTFVPSSPINMSDFTDVCGRRMFPEARIVGGEKSSFGKWPWQISLRQWRTSAYLHKCGAALLNENWAITAAHCVDNVPPKDLLLLLGEHDLSTESEPYPYQQRRVQIVASHPQFDPRTFEYDLALLRFFEPVQFQPNIIPVCVPQNDENFVGKTAYVTGWGRLYEDGPLPSVLQEVSVPVINNTVCESMYRSAGYIEHIPNIFICAGWRRGGFDSCEGDSGGPMVIQRSDKRFLLAGVISWGIGCAEPNQPGVYTRISEFRDWINQILQF